MKTQVLTENGLNIYDQELKKYIQQETEGLGITSAIQTTSSTQSGGKNTVTFKDSNGNNVGSVDIYNGQKGENATTTAIATTEKNGLMSSTDKIKIDNTKSEVISSTEPTNQTVGDYWLLEY